MEYFSQSRSELLPYIPTDTRRLLDVGCSEGHFGASVKEIVPDCETWGVEANETAAAGAATRNDHVLHGLFGSVELPDAFFDVVSMNDVLEHIAVSEPALELVRRVLRPGGRLLISVPNVRYYLNVRDLVFKGDWEYRDFGILDRTHLRFFTFRSIQRLLDENGFKIDHIEGINSARLKAHYKLIFALASSKFADMKFPQIVVVCRMKGDDSERERSAASSSEAGHRQEPSEPARSLVGSLN